MTLSGWISGDAYNVGVLMNQLRPWTRLVDRSEGVPSGVS
jgi:hypothetical protein